jgi:hypothetical protein
MVGRRREEEAGAMTRLSRVVASGWLVAMLGAMTGCGGGAGELTELHTVRSGTLDVVLLSAREAVRHGKDDLVIEFRAAGGKLVDVGEVRANAGMPMSGMPMFGSVTVLRSSLPGRYRADAEFSMAGTWRVTIEWDGPREKGSVTFVLSVQ